jgi:hypothetical protein
MDINAIKQRLNTLQSTNTHRQERKNRLHKSLLETKTRR